MKKRGFHLLALMLLLLGALLSSAQVAIPAARRAAELASRTTSRLMGVTPEVSVRPIRVAGMPDYRAVAGIILVVLLVWKIRYSRRKSLAPAVIVPISFRDRGDRSSGRPAA